MQHSLDMVEADEAMEEKDEEEEESLAPPIMVNL